MDALFRPIVSPARIPDLQHPAIYTTRIEKSSQNVGEIEETLFFRLHQRFLTGDTSCQTTDDNMCLIELRGPAFHARFSAHPDEKVLTENLRFARQRATTYT